MAPTVPPRGPRGKRLGRLGSLARSRCPAQCPQVSPITILPPSPAGSFRLRRSGRVLAAALLLAGGALLALPAAATGQVRGVHLPLDHPAHPVAELLVARGVLEGLDGSVRPFPLRALRASVAEARAAGRGGGPLAWLAAALGPGLDAGGWGASAEVDLGLVVGTTVNPELLLPRGDSAAADLEGIRFGVEYGPVALQIEPWREQRGRHVDVPVATGRAEWRWGWVEWGEVDRNWGPPGVTGLLVAPLAGNRAELSFALGPPILRFEYRSASLSDGVSTETGEPVARYWALHRLRWRPTDGLELALWETTLAAEDAGPDEARRSPFTPFSLFGQQGRSDQRNVIVGIDGTWRLRRSLRLETQLALDDFVKLGDDDNPYPHRFGWTVQARGGLGSQGTWRAYGTTLSGLALNTFRREEAYTDGEQGMGRLRPDHVELGFLVGRAAGFSGGDPASGPGWPGQGVVEVGLKWRRQGERTFTDPFPAPPPGAPDLPTWSREIEREVWALVTRVDWLAGPFVLAGEGHLQHRRFPASGEDADWGLEAVVRLVWRIGPFGWRGDGEG